VDALRGARQRQWSHAGSAPWSDAAPHYTWRLATQQQLASAGLRVFEAPTPTQLRPTSDAQLASCCLHGTGTHQRLTASDGSSLRYQSRVTIQHPHCAARAARRPSRRSLLYWVHAVQLVPAAYARTCFDVRPCPPHSRAQLCLLSHSRCTRRRVDDQLCRACLLLLPRLRPSSGTYQLSAASVGMRIPTWRAPRRGKWRCRVVRRRHLVPLRCHFGIGALM
jgi:hypothetical protein